MSESILNIFIVTYNRAPLLRRTLGYLAASCLRDFPITVLNNASTDDTASIALEASAGLSDFKLITHHANVGANANILRAFDHSYARYTWILCDDDVIDLVHFADVLHVLEEGEVDFLHVGAHEEKAWASLGGSYKTPRELLANGYPYFKFSSFTPCNIFKTSVFIKQYLIQGYNNIGNSYPHMPFAIGTYKQDTTMYVAQHQIVTASVGGQSYTPTEWFYWWMRTCELLVNPKEVRMAFLDQWKTIDESNEKLGLNYFHDFKIKENNNGYVKQFIKRYLTTEDKAYLSKLDLALFIKHKRGGLKQRISNLMKKVS